MKKPAESGAIDIAAVQSRMLTRNKLEVTNCDIQFVCNIEGIREVEASADAVSARVQV